MGVFDFLSLVGKKIAADQFTDDDNNTIVVALEKPVFGPDGAQPTRVTTGTPLPTTDAAVATALVTIEALIGTPVSDSMLTVLRAIATNTANIKIDADTVIIDVAGVETRLDTLNAKDFATQTTLAAVLAALGPIATATGQATQSTKLDTLHTDLGAVATQTTSAAILAKLSADPATQTTLAFVLTALGHLTDGTQFASPKPATAAAPARIASSASVVTLQAANANRRLLQVYNESTAILYLKNGSAATLTDYTVQLAPGAYYESPQPVYLGIVTGIWAAANGAAQVTETT